MPFAFGGTGTGGGGGLTLGPPTNSFNGATKAAAETARDTYATANPSWLAQYDAETTFTIQLSWPVTPTSTAYQARRASAWADVTPIIRGQQGLKGDEGDQARFPVFGYINATTAPTTAPTGGTFVQSTDVLTLPTGYAASPSTPATGEETYRIEAFVNPSTDTDTVTLTWSVPAVLPAYAIVAAAEAAETGAETAEAGAETAEAGAEAAQALAEQAAGLAVDVPTGSPRGDLIGTSPTLSTATTTNATVRAFGAAEVWTLEPNAPAGFVLALIANNERFLFPDLHPAGVNGVWYVVEVGGVEIDEVFMPWGGVSQSPANANSVQYLSAVASGTASNLTIRYFARSGDTPAYVSIYGAGTTLPANTVLKVYEAVVRGEKGDPGTGTGVGGATNLSISNRGANTLDIASDTGTDATIPAATAAASGLLSAADKTTLDAGVTRVTPNPAGAATSDLFTVDIDGTVYNADEVVDITNTGLPPLTVDNYKRIFIDHDTPRAWVGHREIVARVAATGDFTDFADADYLGVSDITPTGITAGQYFYFVNDHTWWRAVTRHGAIVAEQVGFLELFPDGDWLGGHGNELVAPDFIDAFDTTKQYLYFNPALGTDGVVRLMTNSSFVAATDREVHYLAEPISDPTGISGILGVTAGTGLSGGGTSGVVTLNVDASLQGFPTIPIVKGGTGEITAVAGLAALGGTSLDDALAAILEGTNITIDRTTDGQITIAVPSGSGSGTADVLIDELGVSTSTITLTDTGAWVGTGITVPASVHGILIDLSPATDDYHFVDWDTIRAKDAGVIGAVSIAAQYETFVAQTTTGLGHIVRIGHDAAGQVLLADDAGTGINIDFLRVERLLVPVNTVGTTFRYGSGAPADTLGADGDSWLDVDTGIFYVRAAGAYTSQYTDQLGTGGGLNQAQVDARITALAALLTGAAFTGAVSGVTPTADAEFATKAYVDGLVNPPVGTHISYCTTSADEVFTEAEFLAGTTGAGNALAAPAYTGTMHVGFARPVSEGVITRLYIYAEGSRNTQNQIRVLDG